MINLSIFVIALVIPLVYAALANPSASEANNQLMALLYQPASFGYVVLVGAIFVYVNTWRKKQNINVPLAVSFSLLLWLIWFVVTLVALSQIL